MKGISPKNAGEDKGEHYIQTCKRDQGRKLNISIILRNSINSKNNIKKKGQPTLPASILYPKNRAAIKTASTDTDARAITIVSSR